MAMTDAQRFGVGAGLGGLGAGLGGLFMGGGDNPYDSASESYGKIPGATAPFYAPYQQAGQNALNQSQNEYSSLLGGRSGLQNNYNSLMNDPSGIYNRVASGYHQSPGYQWQLGQGINAANNAAASGGMLGTPQHQQQAATMAEGLANQDFNNYLTHGLSLYSQGLQGNQGLYNLGLEGNQNLNTMGYGANDQMAKILADMYSGQGQMQFAGQAAQNQSQGQTWGNILGSAGTLAAFL